MKTHKFADYKGDPWAEALAEQAEEPELVTHDILGQDEIDALMQDMYPKPNSTNNFKGAAVGIQDSEGTELYEGDHLWCKYYLNNIDGTIAFRRGVIRYQAPSFVVMVDSSEGLVPFNFNALFSFKKIQPVNF
jgi:hypothetical protein